MLNNYIVFNRYLINLIDQESLKYLGVKSWNTCVYARNPDQAWAKFVAQNKAPITSLRSQYKISLISKIPEGYHI